ncbi:MAG: hypothetical protein WCI51_01640 [Lentisphaerota bacterium]
MTCQKRVWKIINRKMNPKTPGLGCCLFCYKTEKCNLNRVTQGLCLLVGVEHGFNQSVPSYGNS